MLGNGITPEPTLRHGAGSPQRPRHQINRSITEVSSPTRLHRHHHSSHHHSSHHHTHRHQASSSGGSGDTSTVYGHAPPRTSVELPASRPEVATPNITPNPSRRPSILAPAATAIDDAPSRPPPPASAAALERRPAKEEDPTLEKEMAQATAIGLKTAVTDLNTTSTATARRLDDAYASVMDKLGTLGNTAAALEELRVAWRDAADGFTRETDELLADVSAQIDGLGTFEPQRRRIESLQSRIHDGRERIQRLSGRVDAVHDRIEGWERADREWQERTRRRLKTVWVVTSVLVLVVIAFLFVVAGHAQPPAGQDAPRSLQPQMAGKDGTVASPPAPAAKPPDWARPAIVSGHIATAGDTGATGSGEHGGSSPGARLFKSLNQSGRDSRVDAEQHLRAFDEL